jgi:hypothetical protein
MDFLSGFEAAVCWGELYVWGAAFVKWIVGRKRRENAETQRGAEAGGEKKKVLPQRTQRGHGLRVGMEGDFYLEGDLESE